MNSNTLKQGEQLPKGRDERAFIENFITDGLKLPNIARNEATRDQIQAVVSSMHPKDEAERMLLIQMCLVNRYVMKYMHHESTAFWTMPGPDEHAKLIRAEKLMKLYATQLQTLQKYRNNGVQRIIIERLESEQTILAAQAAVNQTL